MVRERMIPIVNTPMYISTIKSQLTRLLEADKRGIEANIRDIHRSVYANIPSILHVGEFIWADY
ncbi:hypothetical protein DRQ23_07295 [bacterium]|nr:MAG: hypothetical protein DRQ23_07295 [bacterium]